MDDSINFFVALFQPQFLTFKVSLLYFLQLESYLSNIGLIKSYISQLKLEYIPKLTELGQNVSSANKNLIDE